MGDDRVQAEEKCLRQQTRILEQIRELKKIDLSLFQYESICQDQIDAEFAQRKEIERLETLCRLAERILDLHNMVEKADKTIEVMTGEIKQYQDERARSKSEPVHQSTPLKPFRVPERDSTARENLSRSGTVQRESRFDSIYSQTTNRTKQRSQSYRETKSDLNVKVPLLKPVPNMFFRSRDHKERRLPIPVEIPRVPDLPSSGPVKKSFHPRLVIERKAELNQSIRRTASDIAITDKLATPKIKSSLPTSKSERKLTSYDNDSDTGVSSMHSSENDFRYSPDRKVTLV